MSMTPQTEAAAALARLAHAPMLHRPESALPPLRRAKRLRDPREVGLNIIPLVDVTFLLMIFFVIAGSFETWEGVLASHMPRTAAAVSVPLPISPIVVRLQSSAVDVEACTIKIDRFKSQPSDFTDLAVHLKEVQQQPGFDQQTPVVIIADDEVRWDHVVSGWNAAVRAGCKNLVFGRPQRP